MYIVCPLYVSCIYLQNDMIIDYIPARTNRIPQINVKFFLPDLHCPTKQIMAPISRMRRLAKGNHVDLLIVTEIRL